VNIEIYVKKLLMLLKPGNESLFMQKRRYQPFVLTGILLVTTAAIPWPAMDDPGLRQAPDIMFPLTDGREISLSGLAGKAVLVSFWATACIECRKEIPDLISLYRELAGKGLEIIAVAMPYDPPNRVLEISTLMDIPYPIALDIHGTAVKAFDVAFTPSSFLISPHGRIINRHTGAVEPDSLRKEIINLLDNTDNAMSL